MAGSFVRRVIAIVTLVVGLGLGSASAASAAVPTPAAPAGPVVQADDWHW